VLDVTDDASRELALAIADTTLAAGLRYGRWVERAPSTEEQVAVSSMSQDKLGQARQFYQIAEASFDVDAVELQYNRDPDAFAWNPAWLAPWPSWGHLVVAQITLGRGLLEDLSALAEDTSLREPFAKIQQEDSWHARHGSAWLSQVGDDESAREHFQAALDDLWPPIVAYYGAVGEERFPEDREAGVVTRSDDEKRQRLLDEIVPQLEDAGLEVPGSHEDDGWTTKPSPTQDHVARVREAGEATAIELAAMLQDPEHRALAEL
jgi:phenylacetate-CoA oxygenase PaaI subunit